MSNFTVYSEFRSSSSEGRKELIGPHLVLELAARVRPMLMEFKQKLPSATPTVPGTWEGALLSFYREAPTKRGTFFRLSSIS